MTAALPYPQPVVPEYPQGGPTQLQLAWGKLAGGAPRVVDVLLHIAEHGENDSVRVQASMGVLKMGGFGQQDVQVRIVPPQYDQAAGVGDGRVSQTKIITERLERLAAATAAAVAAEEMAASGDYDSDDVIDAEIIEDS